MSFESPTPIPFVFSISKPANQEPKWQLGQRVRAKVRVRDEGISDTIPDAERTDYIHAEPGDMGTVEYVDEQSGYPTVRFDRTGTSTMVTGEEVVRLLPC